MRILVTSDWHIGLLTHGTIDDNGRNSKLTDVTDLLDRIIAFAAKQRVDAFIQAGDIFHTNIPTPDQQAIFLDVIYKLEDAKIPSRFIIGNHDYSSKLGQAHALTVFQKIRGLCYVKIYDKTTTEILGDTVYYFMPYRGATPLLEMDTTKPKILVCHSHLQGAVVGSEPYEIQNDIAFKFAELPVDIVLAGHFHKPQLLSKSKPLAFYPGSIQKVDFNERDDVKGVVLLDTNTLKYQCAGFKTRKFYQIELNDQVNIPDAPDDQIKDAVVKVILSIPEHMVHEYSETALRDKIMSMGAHHIAAIDLNIQRQRAVRDADITIETDVRANFLKYIDTKNYGDDKPLVAELGDKIITELQSN